jgi:hypothetical protein
MVKRTRTSKDLQNTTQKTKDRAGIVHIDNEGHHIKVENVYLSYSYQYLTCIHDDNRQTDKLSVNYGGEWTPPNKLVS